MPADAAAAVKKKHGPLPAWAWVVAAVAAYFLYKRFASGGTSAANTSPTSIGTGTNSQPIGTGGGAPASGQGSAMDNISADLLAAFGSDLVQVNSNLVTGLLGSQSAIEGLGSAALSQSGQLEQAIIDGKLWGASTGGAQPSSGGSGSSTTGGHTGSSQKIPTTQVRSVWDKERAAHDAAVKAAGQWTAGF